MKQRRDAAFVLGTRELGEADLIVTLLAEHAGRVRGVAPSARKSRRRFGGSLEPMSRVSVAWTERLGRDLHRIEGMDLERSFAAMQSAPERQAACAVLAEVAQALSRENEGEPREFRLLGAVLEALEAGLDPWVAVRYFELWSLRLHGLLPDLACCAACGRRLEHDGMWMAPGGEGLRCPSCAAQAGPAARRLSPAERAFLREAVSRPPSEMAGHEAVVRPGGALEVLLLGTLQGFAERSFRTYRHLRAATGNGEGGRR